MICPITFDLTCSKSVDEVLKEKEIQSYWKKKSESFVFPGMDSGKAEDLMAIYDSIRASPSRYGAFKRKQVIMRDKTAADEWFKRATENLPKKIKEMKVKRKHEEFCRKWDKEWEEDLMK